VEALRWLQQPQLANTQIAIETDCIQVAQAIHTRHVNITEFENAIDLCHNLLNENDHCKVSYIRRQVNRVTQTLAQTTHFTASPQVYNYCPSYIKFTIINEMN
jgi:hypothetical protein